MTLRIVRWNVNRSLRIQVVTALAFVLPQMAQAVLSAPISNQSAAVLPKGIWSPEFDTVNAAVEMKFDGTGIAQPLGAALNSKVSWMQVVGAQPSDADKASAVAVLNSAGITDLNSAAGETTGQVNTLTSAMVPMLRYGVSSAVSVGVAVPVVRRSLSVATGFVSNPSTAKMINTAAAAASPEKADRVAGMMNSATAEQLRMYGYNPLVPRTVTTLGDVKVGGKVRVLRDNVNTLSIKPEVSLPTGSKADVNEPVDLSTSAGDVAVTMSLVHDWSLLSDMTLTTYAGYTVQKNDSLEQRIPLSAASSISPDREVVDRSVGDIVRAGGALSYGIPSVGLTLAGGYHFSHQGQTRYSGKAFAQERYSFLEAQNPAGTLHSGIVSLNFSSIRMYQQKSIPVPFQATLNYAFPIAGKNSYQNNTVQTEMVMYF